MASSTPVCGICDLRSINKAAILWCFECDEGLCSECKDHHSLSKGSRNHDTATISDYQQLPSDVVKITQNCGKHNEKFTIYCKKHECLCCGSCIVESHMECRDFGKLADIVQNIKFSNAFSEIEKSLADLSDNIKKIRHDRENNRRMLSEKKRQIEQEIKQTRTVIDNHLDKIEDEIMKQLIATEETESKQISELLDLLKGHANEITEYLENIENIKQHATDLQTFISMKELEKQITIKDEYLQAVVRRDNKQFKDHELLYNPNAAMLNFANHIKNFGEVKTVSKPCNLVLSKRKDKQAQIMLQFPPFKLIENIRMKHISTINDIGNDTYGCCMLPDGRTVFTDYSKQTIRVFNSNGSNDFEVKTSIQPFDVVYISDENTLAVTSGGTRSQCITIIDIPNKQIKKEIQVDFFGYGIVVKDDKVICSASEKGIQLINLHNNQPSYIVRDKIPYSCYISTLGDNIYHTDHQTNSVACYDHRGTVKWKFKNESVLRGPRGLAVDDEGNVYVVGNASNNVVVISSDGQQHKEILTARDGLSNAFCIEYNGYTNELLVANKSDTANVYLLQ